MAVERRRWGGGKKGRKGGRRSIFQKRNLICPEVCHGTRINSRALESRRERLLRATARASIGCHSTFPLFPRRRAIIERRRLWCTRLAPGKLLSLSLSYPLSNEASFQGVYKKKKKYSRKMEKFFERKLVETTKKKGGEAKLSVSQVGLIHGRTELARANIARRISRREDAEQELKDEHETRPRHFPDTRRSTSLCPKKNEKSPTHRFRMR